MKSFRPQLFLVLSCTLMAACSDPGGPQIAAVAIAPRVSTLALGDSLQLAVTVTDGSGNPLSGISVTWASGDTAILSVSSTGLVRALGSGTTTITASAGNAHDDLSVLVSVRFARVAHGVGSVICAVATNRDGYCRGNNEYGMLGNGTTDSTSTFVPVAGGLEFSSILIGSESTCGLATDSTAHCWGLGAIGLLGSGDTMTRLIPNPVIGGLRFTNLAQGELHACGLTPLGTTYCWGWGSYGATGDPDLLDHLSPITVPSAPPFVALAAGGFSNCGLTAAHAAYCWGDNWAGQLGSVTDTVFHEPVPVAGGHAFQTLSLHEPNCGLAIDGTAYCWGVIGLVLPTPTAVPGGLHLLSISTAYPHGCGIATDSSAYCWLPGQVPDLIPGGFHYHQVASGVYHDCALTADSSAYCWLFHCGYSLDVVCNEAPAPALIPGGQKFTTVSSGDDNESCGLSGSGTAYCWFVVGNVDSVSTMPIAVPGGTVFTSIVVGGGTLQPFVPQGIYGCGLATDSTAQCWGFERNVNAGGITVVTYAPVPVPGGLKYVSLDTWGRHVCGLAPGGTAYCWSPGDVAPVPVPGGQTFVSVFTSYQMNCGLTAAAAAYCWGSNSYGQMGLGFASRQSVVPLPVLGSLSFASISMGYSHTCGLTVDSLAYCWGSNSTGALGTGDSTNSIPPRAVATALRFGSLSAGYSITCGIAADSTAACWGRGTLTPAPQQPGTHFTSLSANGFSEVCGTTSAGDVLCWSVSGTPAPPPRSGVLFPDRMVRSP